MERWRQNKLDSSHGQRQPCTESPNHPITNPGQSRIIYIPCTYEAQNLSAISLQITLPPVIHNVIWPIGRSPTPLTLPDLFSLICRPSLCPRRRGSQSLTYLWGRTKKPIFSVTRAIFICERCYASQWMINFGPVVEGRLTRFFLKTIFLWYCLYFSLEKFVRRVASLDKGIALSLASVWVHCPRVPCTALRDMSCENVGIASVTFLLTNILDMLAIPRHTRS